LEAHRFENQAKAFDKRGKYKSYILRKGLLEESQKLLLQEYDRQHER
jgi:hypothetical protein